MANGRGNRKRASGRVPGGFVALPWDVLDSAAYQGLSHPARALLVEVARQFHSDDNGRMLLSAKYLRTRGWTSADVIQRAKQELLDAGLIFETVKGHRPNKASWYAMTWQSLDKLDGFDPGVAAFERGAYKNASLTPRGGIEKASIAPPDGTRKPSTTPRDGAIKATLGHSPTPPDGNPLEKPSAGVGVGAVGLHGQHTRSPAGEAVGSTSRLVADLVKKVSHAA